MGFKTTVKLDARIFNDAARRQALSAVVSKAAKEFKNATKRRMIESSPGGKLYEKGRGNGFTRSHRASRRGQRPALETGNLVNAVVDVKTSDLSATVEIANSRNPENGENARDYAERLQNEMNRPIITEQDISEASVKFTGDCAKILRELSK